MKNNTTKHIFVLINVLVLCLIAGFGYGLMTLFEQKKPTIIQQPDAPIETIAKNAPAPNFTFVNNSNQKPYTLNDFKGKIIILNFWASWCPPCIKEFPNFITAAEEFKNDVIFIGVSSDLDAKAMNTFLNKPEIDTSLPNIYITLDENDKITKTTYQTYRLPETILIDKNGIMRTKLIGADWDYQHLKTKIEELL